MEKILNLIKKFIPRKIFLSAQPIYHYLLPLIGALVYAFPAKKIKVIAVTGTKGKTSTVEILAHILKTAGYKTATTSTLQFRLGEKITRNLYKMSMPGRLFMQKFLWQALKARCDFAILEMTSEGSKVFRHKFIDLDGLIFTNISPEHIEAHGSYEKYLEAKLTYAKTLNKSSKKDKILVVNGDDQESEKFVRLAPKAKTFRFFLQETEPFKINNDSLTFVFDQETITVPSLTGKFNLYNILGASKMAQALGVKTTTIKQALETLKPIAGRLEKVWSGQTSQNFEVIVDYAHTADSLTKVYETFPHKTKICVLGACGGGRDKWKRPQMGEVANNFCNEIILTNEDPYDEDPEQIINEIASGINKPKRVIMDRREAIKTAIQLARQFTRNQEKEVVVLITGKGTDPYIMGARGQKIPWSDYTVARDELLKALG